MPLIGGKLPLALRSSGDPYYNYKYMLTSKANKQQATSSNKQKAESALLP